VNVYILQEIDREIDLLRKARALLTVAAPATTRSAGTRTAATPKPKKRARKLAKELQKGKGSVGLRQSLQPEPKTL
jgi:hypothetical protein